jgi:YVTN family beta-propeller protein
MNSFTKNNTVSKFVKLTNSGFPGIFFTLLCAIFMISSCDNKDDFGEINTQGSKYNAGAGVFILNEGNFGQGNGSLSFLRFDSSKIENDIFFQTNNRPLGDVPFSMSIIGENAWIAVNNSAKIEILALKDLSQVATIEGFLSPRFILEVAENKAYVSDLYGDEISVLDTKNYSISGKISLGYSSEQMVLANNLVFVAFWSNYAFPAFENNKVFIINPANDQLTDSIEVGKEPNSMVVDKNMKVWVLCSGGFMNEEIPTLQQINPETLEVEEIFAFGNIQSSPSSLCINGTLDTLFFISSGIFRMSITENKVPEQPFIPEQEHLYYQIAVDPKTSDIYATDAIDYQQNGLILRYKPDGTFIDFHHAGIIPGQMIFR